jgi:hypothetical protein
MLDSTNRSWRSVAPGMPLLEPGIRGGGPAQQETGDESISSISIPIKSKKQESQKTQRKLHSKRLRKKIHLCDNYIDNIRT